MINLYNGYFIDFHKNTCILGKHKTLRNSIANIRGTSLADTTSHSSLTTALLAFQGILLRETIAGKANCTTQYIIDAVKKVEMRLENFVDEHIAAEEVICVGEDES